MINPVDSFVDEGRPPLGFTSVGARVYAPFRPSALFLANVMDQLETSQDGPNVHLPLPEGMRLVRSAHNAQLQLLLDDVFSHRNRRLFGYVGEISLSTAGRGAAAHLYVWETLFFSRVGFFLSHALLLCLPDVRFVSGHKSAFYTYSDAGRHHVGLPLWRIPLRRWEATCSLARRLFQPR